MQVVHIVAIVMRLRLVVSVSNCFVLMVKEKPNVRIVNTPIILDLLMTTAQVLTLAVREVKRVLFTLAPALVGKSYAQHVKIDTPEQVYITAIEIDPKTGLMFDERNQIVTGEPLVAGQHHVIIHYQIIIQNQSSSIKKANTYLLINPDPRSLWKNIPSDPTQLYAKPDSASQIINSPSINMLAASQRGRSHAHKGDARDDDFFIAAGEHWQLAIVADGAGSAKYSRYGSQLICHTIGHFFSQVLARPIPLYQANIELELKDALNAAVCALEAEAQAQQAEVKDYASTVLVVLCVFDSQQQTYVYWTVAVGDGAIALYWPQTQQAILLNTPDTGDYAGETRFLGHDFMQAPINRYCSKEFVPCLLMTDGVSDAFFDSDNALKSGAAWQNLWCDLQQNQALEDDKNLLAWLDFWSKGNHDDRTLVLMLGNTHD